jgi:hypothetical protein
MSLLSCDTSALPDTANGSGPLRRCRSGALPEPPFEASVHHPDLWLYRDRTVGLLRRYVRLSVEAGRLPSLLGRELFRTRVTAYQATTFEDTVIFVHDVASGLAKLDRFANQLIVLIALQDYTQRETARLLGCRRRTVGRRYPEAVDQLTAIFLNTGLLVRLPVTDAARAESCQEGKMDEIPATDSGDGK